MLPFTLAALIFVGAVMLYRRSRQMEEHPPAEISDDKIKQGWRQLGFFCELDEQKRVWTLTASRRGLLYFPDLLLGYVNDPQNAIDGSRKHYGPYGSLEIVTWHDAGFDGHGIRGSLDDLTRLAELVETKLIAAEPGESIQIRDEYAPESPFSLVLDVRADGFDPSSTDREHLGAVTRKDIGGSRPAS
jgi:hypothetical protein